MTPDKLTSRMDTLDISPDRTTSRAMVELEYDLGRFRDSIARMCNACEPDLRECRDRDCPLRSVSPFKVNLNPFGPIGNPALPTSGSSSGEWPPSVNSPLGRDETAGTASGAYGGGLV